MYVCIYVYLYLYECKYAYAIMHAIGPRAYVCFYILLMVVYVTNLSIVKYKLLKHFI